MDRQCRICLDTEDPESMISPCMCSGKSAYIHQACLDRYLQYYPDGNCRVCNYSLCFPNHPKLFDTIVFLVMVTWLTTLLFLSTIPGHFKILYMFMMISVLLFSQFTEKLRPVLCLAIMIVSSIFTILSPTNAVHFSLIFGLLSSIVVMFIYIPPEFMLLFVTILLAGAYSTIIVAFFSLNQDAYLTGFFVPLMILIWMCVIQARPPLRR